MSLFNAIRMAYQSTKTLGPIFDNIRDDNWYVSIGKALPDDQGLLVGGRVVPWPSPAHRAVWEAARRGFTTGEYDAILMQNGFAPRVDSWTRNAITPLSTNGTLLLDRTANDLSDDSATLWAGWNWHWLWRWEPSRSICSNPADPKQFLPIPRSWNPILSAFSEISSNDSIGLWVLDWWNAHGADTVVDARFDRQIDALLTRLTLLIGALQFYGGGYLDLYIPVALKEAHHA